mmetsp:Transcript_71756/g.116321  ORF Transcript_71756/g.116321 Transcript_71756/m.116321 type:complete len:123 (+) Transcript_71756:1129-1497(+)
MCVCVYCCLFLTCIVVQGSMEMDDDFNVHPSPRGRVGASHSVQVADGHISGLEGESVNDSVNPTHESSSRRKSDEDEWSVAEGEDSVCSQTPGVVLACDVDSPILKFSSSEGDWAAKRDHEA